MDPDKITAYLLSDPTVFVNLCTALTTAAGKPFSDPSYIEARNRICILPANTESITRNVKPLVLDVDSAVKFVSNDLTIVGGSAVYAYDLLLRRNLSNYLSTPTSDIDAVWWPRISFPQKFKQTVNNSSVLFDEPEFENEPDPCGKEAPRFPKPYFTKPKSELVKAEKFKIVSSSPAIRTLALAFRMALQNELNSMTATMNLHISSLLAAYFPQGSAIHITTQVKHTRAAGVWNVSAQYQIGGICLKLIDVSIHDGASSQFASKLEEWDVDPAYTPWKNIIRLPYSYYNIPVPYIVNLIDQQRLALKNRVSSVWQGSLPGEKAQTHYRRIRYFYDVLHSALNTANPDTYRVLQILMMSSVSPQYITSLYSILQDSYEGIASCPWTLQYCAITPENPKLLELCGRNQVITKSICPPKTGGGKTRKNRSPRRKTRRMKKIEH